MTADKFVDEFLELDSVAALTSRKECHLCPLLPFRDACEANGLTTREVLAAVRSRYGNGSKNPNNPVDAPYFRECRIWMPDGSHPRGFAGFSLKHLPAARSPFVQKIWDYLPYRGPVDAFPIAVTSHQLAGAAKSPHIQMVREKGGIWIAKHTDHEYEEVAKLAKRNQNARQERKRNKYHRDSYCLDRKPESQPKLPPFTAKIWGHLPYSGPIENFPIRVSRSQLAGACRSRLVAMIARNDKIRIVRYTDADYDTVRSLAKDRRTIGGDRVQLWQEFLEIFPHPPTKRAS